MADTLLGTFRQPFAEQVAAWRLRMADQIGTAAWDDLWQAQHDRAFVVAGAMKADLLADLAGAVDKAITQGTTLEQFRRDFRAIVEARGWHGWTGEGTARGEAWRTRVIYQTNLRTSYMAGRHAQLRKSGYPFWVYRHGGSREPRLHHLSWDGVALPADHPFWAQHYPPNGWGCSCEVRGARTEAGIRRAGGDPDKRLPPGWDATNPRTGAQTGIDKGWGYAPGATVTDAVTALAPKLATLPDPVGRDLVQDWVRSRAFETWTARPMEPFPLALLDAAQAARIGASVRTVSLSPDTFEKQRYRHPELRPAEYARVQDVIAGASDIIQDGAQTLVFVTRSDSTGYVLVVRATNTGDGLFVTSFRRLTASAAETDRELRRLRRRGI